MASLGKQTGYGVGLALLCEKYGDENADEKAVSGLHSLRAL